MNLKQGSPLADGRYKIERVLGSGGFGITYLGEQTGLSRKVAIKEFFMKEYCERSSDTSRVSLGSSGSRELVSRYRDKFIKEARNIARLKHPNIVQIIDIFEDNGTAYYVMEYLPGDSLAAKVKHSPLPESEALKYIRQVSSALSYVHSRKMMHLDVKPANILLNEDGEAILVDFGLSKQYDSSGAQTSTTPVGISHGYAPLEQYKKGGVETFSPSTDIYSLGATLYKLLTGTTPPDASDIMDNGLPPLPSTISPCVRRAIEKAMEPRRASRPQSIAEFLSILSGTTSSADDNDETVLNTTTSAREDKTKDSGEKKKETERKSPFPVAKTAALLAFILCISASIFILKDCSNPGSTPASQEDSTRLAMEELREQRDRLRLDSINAAENKRKQEETERQAALAAENKRKQEETERQAALAAENKRKQEEAERQAEKKRKQEEAARQSQGISTSKAVDLGLSVKWAGWNVGASSPEEYGGYYAWGETSTKSDYSWGTYKYCNSSSISMTKYCTDSDYGTVDNRSTLQPSDDVARVKWGGSWRMPTSEEINELKSKCKWEWTTYKEVNGYKVTGPNGNSIFLPAAGYRNGSEVLYRGSLGHYWSSSLNSSYSSHAFYLYFRSYSCGWNINDRYYGRTVRPVSE